MSVSEMRATMKQNRAERKAMADSRAMEEQMERHNPISGTGATPSMGLSQVRGGAKMMSNAAAQGKMLMEHLGSLHGGAYAKQFHDGMKGAGFFSNLGHGLSDVAGMFGLGKCGDNEKMKGGLHTGRYEGEGMGTRFSRDEQDFSSHMKGEGRFSDVGHKVSDIAGMFGLGKLSASEKKALKSVLAKHEMDGGLRLSSLGHSLSDVAGMFGLGKHEMDGKGAVSDIGHKMSDMLPENYSQFGHFMSNMANKYLGLGSGQMDGCGSMGRSVGGAKMTAAEKKAMKAMLKKHEGGRRDPVPYGRPQKPVMELMNGGLKISDLGHNLSNVAEAFGPNRVGKVGHSLSNIAGMFGLGKKEKRVVGAGDGRRKRADIVRKVMAEKGMKMIEASKYVKEHGLYKP
jgi:hypothetical protein